MNEPNFIVHLSSMSPSFFFPYYYFYSSVWLFILPFFVISVVLILWFPAEFCLKSSKVFLWYLIRSSCNAPVGQCSLYGRTNNISTEIFIDKLSKAQLLASTCRFRLPRSLFFKYHAVLSRILGACMRP